MKFFKQSAAFVLGFLLLAGSAMAQGKMKQMKSSKADSITDKELKKFAAVTSELQKMQQTQQRQVQNILAEKDMEMRRFQQIMMSKRNPKMADSIEVTAKEKKTMKEIQPKLQKMQQQSRKKMMGAMQENGLNPQRFQAIMRAVQSDRAVMQRFQKIAQENAQKN
jgi:hypothetical protein